MNDKKIVRTINKFPLLRKVFYRKLLNKNSFLNKKYNSGIVKTDDILGSTPIVKTDVNTTKLNVCLVNDGSRNNYASKYEKFLIQNGINYEILNADRSSFLEDVKRFNLVIWRISDKIPNVGFCKNKIYFIQNVLNIKVYPSYEDIWSYEDKSLEYYLFKEYGFQFIPTFYSNDYDEAVGYIKKCNFPVVSKELTSCSSSGVKLLKNRKSALHFLKKVFGEGASSSFLWSKQKNYVLLQKFIDNGIADIRVVCIGGVYFAGYYRLSKKNDFRASGSGLVVKKEIPLELLERTKAIYNKFGMKHMFAVDYLETSKHEYLIIESSQFIGIETPQQTKKDDVPGIYKFNQSTGNFDFINGDFWLQELDLKLFLESEHFE